MKVHHLSFTCIKLVSVIFISKGGKDELGELISSPFSYRFFTRRRWSGGGEEEKVDVMRCDVLMYVGRVEVKTSCTNSLVFDYTQRNVQVRRDFLFYTFTLSLFHHMVHVCM